MEQQGTVNNRTFVLLNFRSIIVATPIYLYIYIYLIYRYACKTSDSLYENEGNICPLLSRGLDFQDARTSYTTNYHKNPLFGVGINLNSCDILRQLK